MTLASFTGSNSPGEPYLPATLDSVHRCPARSDYLDLRFVTSEGSWQWCFPEPPDDAADLGQHTDVTIVFTFGRYGALAHLIRDGELGPAMPSAAALPLILADARVLIEPRLLTSGGYTSRAKGPAA